MRARLRASDALFARAAARLERLTLALNGAPEAALRDGVAGLAGFARELRLIAAPREPVALRLEEIDLVELVARVLAPELAGRRGADVELGRAGALRGRYDVGYLHTVLGELLSNAMKYAGGEPVGVRLRATRGRARLTIDNVGSWAGPRRPPERFVREERRARVQGFGVGLWLVTRLVRAHRGTVRYACKEGRSCVTVSLPLGPNLEVGELTATVRSAPPRRARRPRSSESP
ncbi:MAG: ATP-binding protein [Myxococcales bacterium]|nr:ATP-binding protein [Myxococcales bacterium]MBL0198080.1 ATP-binding protein [Myxococcales bacterium]HQY61586.1 ATP-binding protein [Polyangiaceae bacterium]